MSATVPDPIWDLEDAMAQGFRGFEVDPTPNSAYAMPGAGPTPETDPATRQTARERLHALAQLFSGRSTDDVTTATAKTSSKSSAKSSS